MSLVRLKLCSMVCKMKRKCRLVCGEPLGKEGVYSCNLFSNEAVQW